MHYVTVRLSGMVLHMTLFSTSVLLLFGKSRIRFVSFPMSVIGLLIAATKISQFLYHFELLCCLIIVLPVGKYVGHTLHTQHTQM